MSKYLYLLIFVLFGLIYWYLGLNSLDPDFGWHLTMGKTILSSGIPQTDPFSYTMSSYPFVDHEWLTNVFISQIYDLGGFNLLSIIYSLFALSGVYLSLSLIQTKIKPKTLDLKTRLFVLILAFSALIPFVGIRPQVQSWLLLAILLKIIFDPPIWSKFKWFLPLYFVFWTNLHASFALGIAVLSLNILLLTINNHRIQFKESLLLFTCFLATLINPYTWRIWWEVAQQFTDSSLRWNIIEWYPGILNFHLAFFLLAILTGVLLYKQFHQFSWPIKCFYFIFLIMGLSSQRHIPFAIIFCLPIAYLGVYQLSQLLKSIPNGLKRFDIALSVWLIICFFVCLFSLDRLRTTWLTNNPQSFYPVKAVNYLRHSPSNGQLFSDYGWGGYLIWQLPGRKVFIDGRMPSWRWQAPPGESNWAFMDYEKITEKSEYQALFDQYNVKLVLWHKQEKTNADPTFYPSLTVWLKGFGFNLDQPKNKNTWPQNLLENGWQEVYSDDVSVIYERQ